MIKRIIAYGDSFTAGHGVKETEAWPIVLGKMMGVPVNNRGIRGGSNKLSIVKLLNDFSAIGDPSEVLVAFSWTSASRTCFYNHGWQNVLPNFEDKDVRVNNYAKKYYGHIYNDVDVLSDIVLQQIFLTSFFKERNIKYFFVNSLKDVSPEFLESNSNTQLYLREHKSFLSLLDRERFMLGYNGSIFHDYCQSLDMRADDGYHPSAEAHKMVAARAFWFLFDQKIL